MIINENVDTTIELVGEEVTLSHYPNLDSPTYDSSTQVPNYGTPIISTKYSIVRDPTIREIEFSGGKITDNSKRFVFTGDVIINNGDIVTHNTTPYTISLTQVFRNKIICFGTRE